MNSQDNPHFTAYVLGELNAQEAHELHEILASTPTAAHEMEQIEAVADALRHGAPIPQARLSHEQRYAVLHPSNLPRRVQPLMPRKAASRSRAVFWPVMSGMLKAAAVVALTGTAFFVGLSFHSDMQETAQVTSVPTVPKVEPQAVSLVKPEPVIAVKQVNELAKGIQAEAKVATVEPVKEKARAEMKQGPVKKEIVVVNVPPPTPVVPASYNFGFNIPTGRGEFASTTKRAVDQFSLHPVLIKAVPPKAKGEIFASPQPTNAKAGPKPAKVSDLYIHSWKSEIAECPWNQAHRLLRIVIQLPADQPAVLASDTAFPLQISFDPANVKQYRMLAERHLAASELRSAGTHVLWYEFQLNGTMVAARDRHIANVTLSNAKFTSQAVGPFDSSKLQVIDHGYSLQNAREDFVFEASVVGFGLLMRGTEQTGKLNDALVLELAGQTKGTDAGGERARFIRLVQEARRAAGL